MSAADALVTVCQRAVAMFKQEQCSTEKYIADMKLNNAIVARDMLAGRIGRSRDRMQSTMSRAQRRVLTNIAQRANRGGRGGSVKLHHEMQAFVMLYNESSLAHHRRRDGAHILDAAKVTDAHLLLAATMYVAVCQLLDEPVGTVEAHRALVVARDRHEELNMRKAVNLSIKMRSVGNMKLPANRLLIRSKSIASGQRLGLIRTIVKAKNQASAPHCNHKFCEKMCWRIHEQIESLPPHQRGDVLCIGFDMASVIKMTSESVDNTRNTRVNVPTERANEGRFGKPSSDAKSDASQNIAMAVVVNVKGAFAGDGGRLLRCAQYRQTSTLIAPRSVLLGNAIDMVNVKELASTMTHAPIVVGRYLIPQDGNELDNSQPLPLLLSILRLRERLRLVELLCADDTLTLAAADAIQPPLELGDIGTLKVDQLRDALQKHQKSTSGKMHDLQSRLTQVIREEIDESSDRDGSVRTQHGILLKGVSTTIISIASVFADDVNRFMPDHWSGSNVVAELLIALSTLSSLASAIEAHLIAKDEPTLMDWAEDFQDGVIEAMSITKRIPHQLRQRANHVEFSDGGNGVGILYLCVRVLMVLSLKIYDLNSITRVHNAPGGSSGMFAEQSIGAMNVYLSPTESMQGNGNHHAFANLAPTLHLGAQRARANATHFMGISHH